MTVLSATALQGFQVREPATVRSAEPPARSWFGLVVLLAFLAAQVLDGLFTYVGVRRFGMMAEANPLLAWSIGAFGEGPALAGAKLMASTFGIALHLTAVHRIVAALTIFYLAVAILPWAHILFW
jgi:hypothetical protein